MSSKAPSRRVSNDFVLLLKDKVNLIDIVGEHVVLKRSGLNSTGLCPFHSERTPSFSVSEGKQLYHCYGCKAGGDLIQFVMEINGLTFREALEDLAQRANVQVPKEIRGTVEDQKAMEKKATAYRLNRFASMYFRKKLSEFKPAASYLKDRSVSSELSQSFYLGAASSGWEDMVGYLQKSNAPMDLAEELGLIRKGKKKADSFFDLFRDRLIFPTLDLRGRVAGFGGRLLPSFQSKNDDPPPKYLNSPDSFVFQKNRLLFGLQQAKKFIRETEEVILVEGYFDVLALWKAGFPNAVATCGTALTAEHLDLVDRFAKKVILLFDEDSAGQQAMEKAMLMGLKKGKVFHSVSLPHGKDPDEYLNSGPEAIPTFREQCELAEPILDRKIEAELSQAKGNEETSIALKKVMGWLSELKDPVGRELRKESLQKRWGFGESLLREGFKQSSQDSRGRNRRAEKEKPKPIVVKKPKVSPSDSFSELELKLLELLIQLGLGEQGLDPVRAKMPPKWGLDELFSHPLLKTLTKRWDEISAAGEDKEAFLQKVIQVHQSRQIVSIIAELLVQDRAQVDLDEQPVLERATALTWARFSQVVKQELANSERQQDWERRGQLLQDYLDVQRKMKELNKLL